ncbi:MAG: hypothetical protein EXS36_00790 [Pedosphaera sp.]|nr:hypothetical protein [Pedosphaera sp.]
MKFTLLFATLCGLMAALADEPAPRVTLDLATNEIAPLTGKYTNSLVLAPSAEGGFIARIVSQLLDRSHFSQQILNDEMSAKFYERYLDALDPQRIYFTAADTAGFEKYRTTLDDLTRPPNMRAPADIRPAYEMFNRFLERFDQQYAYAMRTLRAERFTFDTEDRYPVNRREELRAESENDLKKIWRDRLRFEVLSEKLNLTPLDLILNTVRSNLSGASPDSLTLPPAGTSDRPPHFVSSLTNKMRVDKAWDLARFSAERLRAGISQPAILQQIENRLDHDRYDEIVKMLTRRYNRTLRTLKQYDSDEVLQLYLDSLAKAYDPHSDYFGRAATENFSISMSLSLFGIGATLQSEDGFTVIRNIVTGSPAEKSKQIKVNDKIVAVAQGDGDFVDVVDEKLDKVVQQIRGPKNTKVRLNIIPEDAPDPSARKVVTLIRDEIKLEDQEAKAKVVELPDAQGNNIRLGVIDLPSFYADFPTGGRRSSQPKSTTRDVARLLKKLKEEKCEGIILDLRRNGGGSLEESVSLAGLFIKSGPIVQVRDPGNRVGMDRDTDPSVLYDGPLIVLTSRFSASASEIVAGALQDYGRALIVGDVSTHGKGTVQTLQELAQFTRALGIKSTNNPGATKITIRKFYRASGASTQLRGITPEIILPSVNNVADFGEKSLTNALPWDTIASADFEKVNLTAPVTPELARRSAERVAADRDFKYIQEDIQRYQKQKAEKAISFNEARRLREKEENKLRVETRKKELLLRHEVQPTTYELTLKLCDQPGLPPAVIRSNIVAVTKADKAALDAGKPKTDKAQSGSAKEATATDNSNSTLKPVREDEEDDLEGAPDPRGVAADINLKETERILLDWISLSNGRPLSVNRQNN